MFGFGKKAEIRVQGFEMEVLRGRSRAEQVLARSMGRLNTLQHKKARWVLQKKDMKSPQHRAHFDSMLQEMNMLEKQIEYCHSFLGIK